MYRFHGNYILKSFQEFHIICLFSDPPSPPINLKETDVGIDFVILTWEPPLKDGGSPVTHYILELCEEKSDVFTKIATIKAFNLTYKVTGLKEIGYYFAVSAQNDVGVSEPCETRDAIVPCKPPSEYSYN